jgi:Xaa-Pro aminopeptidase
VAELIKGRDHESAMLGLVAGNSLQLAPYRRLRKLLPQTRFVEADDLIESVRVIKTAAELERIRSSALVGESILRAILETACRGGCTEADAVAAGYELAAKHGVAMYDVAVASGPHSGRYAHGRLPSWTGRELEDGDVFHVDCYGAFDGYLFDLSRTTIVRSQPNPEQRRLLDGAIAAVEAGLSVVRPGTVGAEVFSTVHAELDQRGLSGESADAGKAVGLAGYDCHGHGFGLSWEWPWLTPWEQRKIEAGMVIAVECMAGQPSGGSVKFEQAVIVGDQGNELLYTLPAYHVEDGG